MLTIPAIPLEDCASNLDAEADLIRAAQADPAAFAPMYQRYRDRIYAYLRTRTPDAEEAADLTQQVFLQAIAGLPRYRVERTPFVAWLVRIAHNAAANYHKRHRQAVAWDLLPEALQPTAGDDPEARALQHEAIERLRDVLADCSAGTREVLALHFAARLTVVETAAAVGKKQLSRTLRALKEHYHDPAR